MYIIHVRAGLNNKLVPLLSLLKIALKNNTKILCYWETNGGINNIESDENHFNNLFENINNLEFINYSELKNISKDCHIMNLHASDRDRNSIIFPENIIKPIFFNQVVHSISLKKDNIIGKYVPYPREKINKNKFIDDLRKTYNLLKPKKKIKQKIDNFINENFQNKKILGLHIRTTDGGFVDINFENIYPVIDIHIINNYTIYISCDCKNVEEKILNKYNKNIIYFNTPFGNKYEDKFDRCIFGNLNSTCEMYILSKCNKFLGTPGSSFSFSVWLLRTENELDFWCKNPW